MSNQFQTPQRGRSDSIDSIGSFDVNSQELIETPPSSGWFNTPDYTPPGSPSEFPNNRTPNTGDFMFEPLPQQPRRGLGRQTTPGRVDLGFRVNDSDEDDMRGLRAALFTGDEDLPEGPAYEVHNKYKKDVNENKILDFLNKQDITDYTTESNIVTRVKPLLIDMADAKDHQKLNDILGKLERATEIRDNPETKNMVGKIVTFVNNQSPEFQKLFMTTVITDCVTAYGSGSYDENNISCPKGIVERFTLSLGNVAMQLNDGSKYNEIIEAFTKPVPKIDIDIERLFQSWSANLDELGPDVDAKENFISYVEKEDKTKTLERDDILTALEQAPLYETYYKDVFKSKQLGGRRKRTLKKRKTKSKTKKRGKPIIRKRVNKTKRRRKTKKHK